GWTCQDIGGPPLAGSQTYQGNSVWAIAGSGTAISGTSDQLHYVYESQAGDGSVSARIVSQTYTNTSAEAGLMVPTRTSPNAPFYTVAVLPLGYVGVGYRATAGASVVQQAVIGGTTPVYLKITRTGGTTFSAATSPDGVTWTTIAGSTVTLSGLSGTLLAGV